MSRTASRERSTAETQIKLSLDLDGGEASAATGVGFLDHMLDLLARHGRLGLRVEANGDLETGAHHTVEDVGIVLGQALDEALGDRAGIRRYGSAAGADGRVAGRVRDRHLRAGRSAHFDADLPTTSIAGFDTELAEEFFRAVANSAKLTLHVIGPLRHQRPPHDRGLLQGLRPRPARRRLDRPRGERRALDQGDAERMTTRIAILDYGMGNLRSVEKALEHVGATATISQRPGRRCAPPTALILPGVGAFPRAMERIRELGLDELIAERREAGVPILGICLGLQLLFDSTTELGGAAGLGLLAGEVDELERRRPQGPAHRLVAGALGARVAPDRGDRAPRRPSTSSTPSRRARRPASCSAAPPTAPASPARPSATTSSASSSTPRSRAPPGLRLLSNFAGICAGPVPA